MIVACWIFAAASYLLYALLLRFAAGTAHDTASIFAVLTVAVWAVLAAHHHRRHR